MRLLKPADPFPPHVVELTDPPAGCPTVLTITHPKPDRGCGLCTLVLLFDLRGQTLPMPVEWQDPSGAMLTGTIRR